MLIWCIFLINTEKRCATQLCHSLKPQTLFWYIQCQITCVINIARLFFTKMIVKICCSIQRIDWFKNPYRTAWWGHLVDNSWEQVCNHQYCISISGPPSIWVFIGRFLNYYNWAFFQSWIFVTFCGAHSEHRDLTLQQKSTLYVRNIKFVIKLLIYSFKILTCTLSVFYALSNVGCWNLLDGSVQNTFGHEVFVTVLF